MIPIACETTVVPATITAPVAFGSTWRKSTRSPDAPDASAASTYSFDRSDRTVARTTRATLVHRRAISHRPSDIGDSGSVDHTARTIRTAIAGTATTTRVA